MREYKAQLDPEESKKIEEHIAKLRKVIDNQEGAEAIRKEAGELQRASLKLFELVYKKMQASSGAAASPYLQSSSPDASASALRGVRFLVVDEADRMAESGRFEELSNILGRVYGSVPRAALQTLVFSATLTLPSFSQCPCP